MIIRTSTSAINFKSCMQNADGLYYKDDVLNCIAKQVPELVKLLPKHIEQWLTVEQLESLLWLYDKNNELQTRLKTASIKKAVRAESQKVYASLSPFFKEYIELGYSDSSALFQEVDFDYLIAFLRKRGEGFDTNIREKEMAHDAIYRLSLNKQSKIYIANERGMEQNK